jgi:hypothetical protein
MLRILRIELERHAPFTAIGALSGILIVLLLGTTGLSRFSADAFWTLHPLHVFLSALVTTSMYRLRGRGSVVGAVVIGYVGSVGIATVSDCLIPYVGEWMLSLPNRGVHLGFVERPWIVNPLAVAGIGAAFAKPWTKLPHAGHVLLSTWASLFHMGLAMDGAPGPGAMIVVGMFLFLAVWLPCCASDIVFPLLFSKRNASRIRVEARSADRATAPPDGPPRRPPSRA